MPALLKCDNSITIRFIYYKLFALYIFKELGILDIFKINDYLTAMFMFRYHHLKNLPEVFENYFLTNIIRSINTTREMCQNSISVIREQTM